MTLSELRQYTLREYGYNAFADLPKRLARVAKFGTSSQSGTTKSDLLSSNRAGPNETHLSTEEDIVRRFGLAPVEADQSQGSGLDITKSCAVKHILADWPGYALTS